MRGRTLVLLPLLLSVCAAFANDTELFESRIRPVLATKCYGCHGADKQFGNLRLDSRERILRGGHSGPAAVVGKPRESLLIKAVNHDGLKMPLGGKLKAEEIAALEKWVETGLLWSEEKNVQLAAGDRGFYEKLIREHWAFQPVKTPPIPQGSSANPIDRFISAKLRESGIAMAAPADRHILARRASYVLTGLPPTREQFHDFLNDRSSSAYERYIDKLIASPQFGERWARHWMDVVRFAETYGYEWNYEIHSAWRYRDYLIRAFNTDVPFDQFIREHIAGDLLPNPRTRDNGRWNESVLATAFYRLGEMGHDNCNQFPEIRTDVVDNQIDTLTKAFQGLTVSCARCHDHKIDPIPTEDYYALYGVLNSSRPVTRTIDLHGPDEAVRSKLYELKSQIRKTLASAWLQESAELQRLLEAAIAWEKDLPEAMETAQGLDRYRISQIRKLLQRSNVDMSDPLYPVAEWIQKPAEDTWRKLATEFAEEAAKRTRFNTEKFVVFADFRKEVPPDWTGDGWGYRTGRSKDGDFAVAGEGGDGITAIYPAGVFTNLLSEKLNGVLRSPMLPKDKKFLTLEVAGGKLGAYRLIMDCCVIGEDHQLLKNPGVRWLRTSTKSDQPLPTYLEFSTKSDNPRLPERPEKFKGLDDDQLVSPRSFWGVTRVWAHDEEVEPKPELSHMNRLLQGAPPRTTQELGGRFAGIVQDAIRAWSEDRASAEDVVWLDWLIQNQFVTNSRNLTAELRALTDEYRKAEAGLADPAVVYSMADVDRGKDFPILIGGQAKSPGQMAKRHYLSLMPARLRQLNPDQSGRLQMADAIANRDNPLTSRVIVNRVWHYTFGRGLVATTDNFGRYGESPTHPELLDYLASRFMDEGWSVKKLVRLMVLSDTFRQSSQAEAQATASDPQNARWHRYPVRRLEAEAVRDAILSVSGTIDLKLFGPSVQPYRDTAKPYRRLFQGPLDGDGRRSIYLKVTRMEGTRFLDTFDFPQPMQPRGNRDITNVPSQSLALLNDPFVVGQAKAWAERLVVRRDDAVNARLASMFETALGRSASSEEMSRMSALVKSLADKHSVAAADVLSSTAVWKDVAHTFFNMKEFIYVR